MALQDIGGLLFYPNPVLFGGRVIATAYPLFLTSANYILNATNTRLGHVFVSPIAQTITHIRIRVRTATTPQTLRVGLYTVDSSGNPTTTPFATDSYGTQASPEADTEYEVALTGSAALSIGSVVAVIVEWDGTQGDVGLSVCSSSSGNGYYARYTTSWQSRTISASFDFAIKYGSTYWAPMPFLNTTTTVAYGANSTYDEYGQILPLPFKCRVVGVWSMFTPTANRDQYAKLYDGTTELGSVTMLAGVLSAAQTSLVNQYPLASALTLTPDQDIRVAVSAAAGGTNDINLYSPTVLDNAHLATWPCGINSYQCKRADAGAWTTDNLKVTAVGLIIDQLDDGVSAGGGPVPGIRVYGPSPSRRRRAA